MLRKKCFQMILFIIISPLALAMSRQPKPVSTRPAVVAKPATQQVANSINYQKIHCPMVSQIVKKGMYWVAGKTWRSDSQSFVRKIERFAGAQWVGINVGSIICLYHGGKKLTFPVALTPRLSVLVPVPTGANWTVVPRHAGYRQCFSNNVNDCPFLQQKKSVPKNVYQEIKYRQRPFNQTN